MTRKTKKLPRGRPTGIPQPTGPERIARKMNVIYDSLLKRALAGEAEAIRLCMEIVGETEVSPEVKKRIEEALKGLEPAKA